MKTLLHPRFGVLAGLTLLAALSRLLPHPPNFAPIGAMALFGGAYFASRWPGAAVPLASLWLSDLLLNNIVYKEYNPEFAWFTPGGYWVWGSVLLTTVLGGWLLRKVSVARLALAGVSASTLFFVITNFGVWLQSGMYPRTAAGLAACYTVALPFYQNTLAGDLFYCAVLFGLFEAARRQFSVLSVATAPMRLR